MVYTDINASFQGRSICLFALFERTLVGFASIIFGKIDRESLLNIIEVNSKIKRKDLIWMLSFIQPEQKSNAMN